jgi:hypothetical protein
MKMKPITIFLPENLYAIASAEAGQLGVDRYLEHFVANHFYGRIKTGPEKPVEVSSNRPPANFSTEKLPDTVLQIYAVVRIMNEGGLSFRKAVKVASNEFGVNESTIRDKCTRRITIASTDPINTDKFIELLRSENLVNHLCQKFPDHRQEIIEKFQPFSDRTHVLTTQKQKAASNRPFKGRAPRSNYGKQLNEEWRIGARHALYREIGDWYVLLKRFPGALCDKNGYILFKSESDYRSCPYLQIGKEISVPLGISKIPGYVPMR